MLAVGGRMEVVTPRRSLFGPDYVRLLALAAVSLAVHVWIISHTAVTARDSVGFARYALGIQSPESYGPRDVHRTALDVIKAEKQPPGYPAAVWITAKFVRKSSSLPLADSTLLATQIVSAIASILLVVPMYLLAKMLFGRNVAFAAALLFQVLPIPARITSDGLTEATYLLGIVSALAVGVRAVRRPTIGRFLMCGLLSGCTYLVRPEGLAAAVAVATVCVMLGAGRKWPRDQALGRLTALGVGVALVAAPYMVLIGKFSNKPTSSDAIEQLPPSLKLMVVPQAPQAGGMSAPIFASFWVSDSSHPIGLVTTAVTRTLQETSQGLHYLGAGLAVVGLFALRRRIAADPGVGLLVVMLCVSFVIVVGLGIWRQYVSGRHVIVIVLIGCYFAAAGLRELIGSLPTSIETSRKIAIATLGVLVVATIPPLIRPIHANREGFKHAGVWLKEQIQKDIESGEEIVLIDPFEWAGCYSEYTLHTIPHDSRDAHIRYTVLDQKNHTDEHARLLRMNEARAVSKSGTAVYWWPQGVSLDEAQVVVYRTVGPSDNERDGLPKGSQKPSP